MRASGFGAIDVQMQGVILYREAAFRRNVSLTAFYFFIEKFFDMTALDANQMIVMIADIEFIDGFIAIEMMADEESGLLELGQNPIDGSQADIDLFPDQHAINVFRR